jgi:hypothetical protein
MALRAFVVLMPVTVLYQDILHQDLIHVLFRRYDVRGRHGFCLENLSIPLRS